MSEINISKDGEQSRIRPSWRHARPADRDWPGDMNAQLEMLESIRNVLEQIRDSQMLRCDVRRDIGEIRRSLQERQLEENALWLEKQGRACDRNGDQEQAAFYRIAAKRIRRRRVK